MEISIYSYLNVKTKDFPDVGFHIIFCFLHPFQLSSGVKK